MPKYKVIGTDIVRAKDGGMNLAQAKREVCRRLRQDIEELRLCMVYVRGLRAETIETEEQWDGRAEDSFHNGGPQ